MEDQLILVDEQDRQIGTCGKMEAHEKALLHRAFSIFVFSGQKLLIQRRAAGKYHCAGLWANSCCSHPRNGEALEEAVWRRLPEETGICVKLPSDNQRGSEIPGIKEQAAEETGIVQAEETGIVQASEETGTVQAEETGTVQAEETGIVQAEGTGDNPYAVDSLTEVGHFIYKAAFDNGLTEYELDHVFVGEMPEAAAASYDRETMRNPQEADEMMFVDLSWLEQDMEQAPEKYAPWFIKALPIALKGRTD